MKRFFTIVRAQFKELPLIDALKLVKDSLFCNDGLFVFEFNVSQLNPSPPDISKGTIIRKGTVEDLHQYVSRFNPVPWEFQCHIYDNVDDFFIAVSDTLEIQHIAWVYYDKDPNRFMRLEPGDAEIKYCLTLPEFRGRGIFTQALRMILSHSAEKGIKRVFICVKEENHASLRGVEKAGFSRVGRIRLIKIMGVQISNRYKPVDRPC